MTCNHEPTEWCSLCHSQWLQAEPPMYIPRRDTQFERFLKDVKTSGSLIVRRMNDIGPITIRPRSYSPSNITKTSPHLTTEFGRI